MRRLFERAAELPAPDRATFVRAEAGTDTHLANEVMALLDNASTERTTWLASAAARARFDAAGAPLPERIGPYRILARLGVGGMGVVYQAELADAPHTATAVKVAQDRPIATGHLDRFVREAQLAATIEHPNCVFVFGGGDFEGHPYLAMELLPGRTLATLVEEQGPLTPTEALPLLLQVCDGLQAIHDADIVHRDVKPSNCLLTAAGQVKVADFGLSSTRPELARQPPGAFAVGTRAFAAPEQLRGDPVDARADVYGATATLLHLLTGTTARGEALAHVLQRLQAKLPSSGHTIDPMALVALLRAGMADDAADRLSDIESLREGLLAVLHDRPKPAPMGVRALAFAADWLLITEINSLLHIGVNILGEEGGVAITNSVWALLYSGLAAWLYFTICEGLFGKSGGKALVGLHLVRLADGRHPGLLRGALRASIPTGIVFANAGSVLLALVWHTLNLPGGDAFPLASIVVLGTLLPGALLFAHHHRTPGQAWHDRITGTTVVRRVGRQHRRTVGHRHRPLPLPTECAEFDPFLQRTVLVVPEEHLLDRPTTPRLVSRATRDGQRVVALALPLGQTWSDWLSNGCGTWAETCKVLASLVAEAIASQAGTDPTSLEVGQMVIGHGGRLVRLPLTAPAPTTTPPPNTHRWVAARCAEVLASRGDESPLSVRLAMEACLIREDLQALRCVLVEAMERTEHFDRRRRAMAAAIAALPLFVAALFHTSLLLGERTVTFERVVRSIQDLQRLQVCIEEPACREVLLATVGTQPALIEEWTRALGHPWAIWQAQPKEPFSSVSDDLERRVESLTDAAMRRASDYRIWQLTDIDGPYRRLQTILDEARSTEWRTAVEHELLTAIVARRRAVAAPMEVEEDLAWDHLCLDLLWSVHLLATDQDVAAAPRLHELVVRRDFSAGRRRWAGFPAEPPMECAIREARLAYHEPEAITNPWTTRWPTLFLLFSTAIAFATRGQWLLRRLGFALVGGDGRAVAHRWQAAMRTATALAPLWLGIQLAEHVDRAMPSGGVQCGLIYKACLLGILLQPVLSLRWPRRLPWDAVAATRIVVW